MVSIAYEVRQLERPSFHVVVQMLRRSRGLTIDALAAKTGIDRADLIALERNPACRPSPLTLHRLSKFFDVPDRKLAVLASAIREVPQDLREHAVKFAAESDSFSKLTKEEQHVLDEFVGFLRADK